MDRLKISRTLLFPVPTMKTGPMARRRKKSVLGRLSYVKSGLSVHARVQVPA